MPTFSFTDAGFAYIILPEPPPDVWPECMPIGFAPALVQALQIGTATHLVYRPCNDEYSYYLTLPGLKLLFGPDTPLDAAKTYTEALVAALNAAQPGLYSWVLLDKQRLAEIE